MKTDLRIEPDVSLTFPHVGIAGIAVSNLVAAAKSLVTESLMDDARRSLFGRGLALENLPLDSRVACWRDACKVSGLSPSTFRSSVEQLARRLLKGSGISTPLPVVTAYCGISAKHLIPLGGYAVDRLPSSEIKVRMARPDSDSFNPIGGGKSSMPIIDTVVVYAAEGEIMCWNWNHRDSLNTCLTASTDNAVFFGETVRRELHAGVQQSLADFALLLQKCGARTSEVKFADASQPMFTLEIPPGALCDKGWDECI